MADGSNTKLLEKWEVLKEVDDEQKESIKFFHAFQTYTGDEKERMSCAMFVTTKDEVFAIGHNNEDNLLALTGDDFTKPVVLKKPRKIDGLSGKNIRKIVVSERFGAALAGDGRLFYWGTAMEALQWEAHNEKYVQLPHEPRENFKIADMACGAHSITFVTDENRVLIWGCINLYYSKFYAFEEMPLRKNVQVKGLATGWYHAALLDQNGHVWTFGYGSVGQLGYKGDSAIDYTTPKKVPLSHPCKKVECGAYSTLFLLENGELYACGSNSQSDHLCVGKTGYVIAPAKVLLDHDLSDIAATYAWSSGRWQSLFSAVSKDGTKYFKWGNDTKSDNPEKSESAESLLDVFADFKTPQSLGELVRVDVVQLIGPGLEIISPDSLPNRSILDRWSIFYVLDEDFIRNISYFTVIGGARLSKHYFGAFVKTKTDDVYSWGLKYQQFVTKDQLIIKSPTKDEYLSGRNIKKIILNLVLGLGLSSDGSLYVWSEFSGPKLEDHLEGKTVTDVSCGNTFYVYLLANSEVYLNGELSVDFSVVSHRKISIPGKEKAVSLASGKCHFLVLTDASNVYAFGDGTYGQLGSTWEKNEETPFLGTKINLPEPCKKIMCGTNCSFFLTETGELYACGSNGYSDPLGVGHTETVYKPEKVEVDEKVKDIAGTTWFTVFGIHNSSFALETASGKIYKWEGEVRKPEEIPKAKFLVEAFEERDIPQSLSLVRLSSLKSDSDNEIDVDSDSRGPVRLAASEKTLFGDPLYSDVTVILKDGVIPSHKVLLHTKSAFFRKALSSNKVVNRDELDFVSYNPKAVRALLKYIYDLPVGGRASSLVDVHDFLKLATEDGNPDLIKEAKKIILRNMVFDMYSYLADTSSLPSDEIKRNTKAIEDFNESSVFP